MKLSALVVDDNSSKIDSLRLLLTGVGFELANIHVAQSVHAARDRLLKDSFDLLLLDIALPLYGEATPDREGGMRLLDEIYEGMSLSTPRHIVVVTGFPDLARAFEQRYSDRLILLLQHSSVSDEWRITLSKYLESIVRGSREAGRLQYMNDVCVVTALREPEMSAVRDTGAFSLSSVTLHDDLLSCSTGRLQTSSGSVLSVIASSAARMGPVNSAVHASRCLAAFRPRVLVLAGICAGVRGRAALGDAILMTPVWDWQAGKYSSVDAGGQPGDSRRGRKVAQVRFDLDLHQIEVDPIVESRFSLLKDKQEVWAQIFSDWSGARPPNIPRGLVGPVAAGSSVVASEEQLRLIKDNQNRKLTGLEMEGYGVYSAARLFLPRPLVFAIKAVCDAGDSSKSDEFQSYAAFVSARVVARFLHEHGDALVAHVDGSRSSLR